MLAKSATCHTRISATLFENTFGGGRNISPAKNMSGFLLSLFRRELERDIVRLVGRVKVAAASRRGGGAGLDLAAAEM